MKAKWAVLVGGGAVAVAAIAAVAWLRRPAAQAEAHFATLEDARQAGAVAEGIPEACLPPSARELYWLQREGGAWGSFDFPRSALAEVRARLTPIAPAELASLVVVEPPGTPGWWRAGLSLQLSPDELRADGVRFFRCDRYAFAIDPRMRAGFYWREH